MTLQHRYTELLEKRIAQLEAIIEASSKNIPNVTADKETEAASPAQNGTDKETAAEGTGEKADDSSNIKVILLIQISMARPVVHRKLG